MRRLTVILFLSLISCSGSNHTDCESLTPYSFFGADSIAFKQELKSISSEPGAENSEVYQTFKTFVDTSMWLQDQKLEAHYDSLDIKDYQLAINCIVLFTDKRVDWEIKYRHFAAVWAHRLLGCFWTDALVCLGIDKEIRRIQNLECYYKAIKKNKSNDLHILYLKMLIADYENFRGNREYAMKLSKELVKQNFFKSYNESF